MLFNGKMSYKEIEQLVFLLKDKIVNSYLKNIYHYNGLWMFKFNHFSFVYEPGMAIWPGEFAERETNLHSVCIKIRKEIRDNKIISVDLVDDDRTVIIQLHNFKIILELYAKGNIILIDNENKIIVLTRIYSECSHGKIYTIKDLKDYSNYKLIKYGWVNENTKKEISDKFDNFENILEAMSNLWISKKESKKSSKEIKQDKKKKNKTSAEGNIKNQISKFTSKIDKKLEEVNKLEDVDYNLLDYEKIGKIHQERKMVTKKLQNAEVALNEKLKDLNKKEEKKNVKIDKIKLDTNNWYQKYHWWITKNGFLVVGGRSSTDNEKLVKSYLNDCDLYFHSEDPGSGSFIMFTENKEPDFIDIDETAEGVLALSNQWNTSCPTGDVFYVKGNQVTKSAPSGEFVGKGSFMIYGKKEFVKVVNCTLGYGIYENKLMLSPYRIINRVSNKSVKLKPRSDIKKMKGKLISNALKKTLNIELNDEMYIFNKPCQIIC